MIGKIKDLKVKQNDFFFVLRKKRIGILYSRLEKQASKHRVKLIYNDKGKIKKCVISPGNWEPVTFKVYVKNCKLFIVSKGWGEQPADLLIPNIND